MPKPLSLPKPLHQEVGDITGLKWFETTLLSPRNSLPAATRPFGNTVVSIAARSQIFKVRALSVPTIERDR